jgi:hypothetical protein
MDCKTARLLLEFTRPGSAELDAAEAGDLERHLSGCPDCDALSRSERQVEEHLVRAMRQVAVPEGLRGQILARLDGERGDWLRRRYGHVLRGMVAAAVLLCVWGWMYWHNSQLPAVDAEQVVQAASITAAGPAEVNAFLKSMGFEEFAPDALTVNYAYLTTYGVSELPGYPGKHVPEMVFTHLGRDRRAVAKLFVVSAKQFNLHDLLHGSLPPNGYKYKLELLPGTTNRVAYLILYTGDDINWLKPQQGIDV